MIQNSTRIWRDNKRQFGIQIQLITAICSTVNSIYSIYQNENHSPVSREITADRLSVIIVQNEGVRSTSIESERWPIVPLVLVANSRNYISYVAI